MNLRSVSAKELDRLTQREAKLLVERATLREVAWKLAMLVMAEAHAVETGDGDGHIGPSEETTKLAMETSRVIREASHD